MHIFNKISSALYGVYTAFIVVLLIAYLFGVLNLNLILSVAGTVSVSMLLISLPLEILGDLLEKQKPIMDKKGKTILVACLLNNMLCLIWGIAYSSLVYDLLVGIPLTIGGIIGTIISTKTLRMNKLIREADLK
jgi:hypothetical protein